jgi:hypothetical protein
MPRPLAIDLFCGLGGWAEGLLAEGFDVVGFDIERHRYPERVLNSGARKVAADGVDFNNPNVGSSRNRSFNYANQCAVKEAPLTGRWAEYPGQLVIQDVLTLHGSQFKDAALIVASPPCQEYSYMAMPWKLAKAKAAAIRADATGQKLADLNRLFDACFLIQAEASIAAGRHIPMVIENVRGAQPWVGRARWNFGSFYLWGDVPALMPFTYSATKVPSFRFDGSGGSFQTASVRRTNPGNGTLFTTRDCGIESVKQGGSGAAWWDKGLDECRKEATGRKAASALIAKIPLPLARHIAAVFRPDAETAQPFAEDRAAQ